MLGMYIKPECGALSVNLFPINEFIATISSSSRLLGWQEKLRRNLTVLFRDVGADTPKNTGVILFFWSSMISSFPSDVSFVTANLLRSNPPSRGSPLGVFIILAVVIG